MWLLEDIGYLALFAGLCLAIALPPLTWWERRWNGAQERLKKADPGAFERQRWRAESRFEKIDMALTVAAIAAAFVVLRRCMEWWSG